MSTNPIEWLKCLVLEHDYEPDRAENPEIGGYTRHRSDGAEERIESCTIVEVCQRCGMEDRYLASVEFAERHGIPTDWDWEVLDAQ